MSSKGLVECFNPWWTRLFRGPSVRCVREGTVEYFVHRSPITDHRSPASEHLGKLSREASAVSHCVTRQGA